MSRPLRLLELLQELRARRRPVTADTLAADLGISIRTLYRDINALRALGAEIEGEAGLGYVLKPGFVLPPLMLTPQEIEAILVGASWVAQRKDLGLADAADSAFAKIAASIPDDLTKAIQAPTALVGAVSDGAAASIETAIIWDALRRERKLRISYVDAVAVASDRTLWPVAISIFDNAQMLAAWCELRSDYRHFRLDRIQHAEVLEAKPPRRRTALYREWRERERACIPEGVHERDR